MNFNLRKPCKDCPFLIDRRFSLHPRRVDEIGRALVREQKTFACHKTVKHDDDGRAISHKDEEHCAGALIMLERMERPNQMMRISERLGFYDRTKLDMSAKIFSSFGTMRAAMTRMMRGKQSPIPRKRK